jgi:hypothetical protein
MAFANARNGNLDERFSTIAVEYMRHGEELGVRWDYAFFQMLVETGNLSFKRGGTPGDVKPSQNNFAGIGATGGGVRGESFPDVTTGVKAHLQHLLMYAGRRIESPVAERTRQVQEWGVLTSWQAGLNKPITFSDLTLKWAMDPNYSGSIASVAKRFYDGLCDRPDPQPELVQQARGGRGLSVAAAEAADGRASDTAPPNKEMEPGGVDGDSAPSGLGAAELAKSDEELAGQAPQVEPGEDADLPPPPRNIAQADPAPAKRRTAVQSERPAMVKTAAAATIGTRAPPTRCRVWTASYGGQRAIIIKAVADQHTNYTVLDVNEGAEMREAEAYIEAYAKGGQQVGEFANQSQALERAFEFCPEG